MNALTARVDAHPVLSTYRICEDTEAAIVAARHLPSEYHAAAVKQHTAAEAALVAALDADDQDRAEIRRLEGVEFVHRGCEMLRTKDNAYLIGERDKALAEVERLRAAVERVAVLCNAAKPMLGHTVGYCSGSCGDGPGDGCEHETVTVAWDLNPDAVRQALEG